MMPPRSLSIGFALISLLFPFIAAAGDQNDEPGISDGAMGYVVAVGTAPLLFNTDQFNDDVETLGLSALSFPLAGKISMGGDLGNGPHYLRFTNTFTFSNQVSHRRGDYAELSILYLDLAFGWRYQFSRSIGLHADVGFAFGEWQYVLITDDFNGQATGRLFGVTPRSGFMFCLSQDMWLNFYGGYSAFFHERGSLYSGDMQRENFDDFDFDHALVGVELMFLVCKHKR